MSVVRPETEWCPGGGDYALDADRWNRRVKHEYFCAGCGRSCKIPPERSPSRARADAQEDCRDRVHTLTERR